MIRDTWEERDRDAGHGGTAAVPAEWAALAAELATEFCAPVAIFDPRQKRWCSVVGATLSQFPEINDSLILACRSTELAQGRAVTWRRPLDCKRVWLLLPIKRRAGGLCRLSGTGGRSTRDDRVG